MGWNTKWQNKLNKTFIHLIIQWEANSPVNHRGRAFGGHVNLVARARRFNHQEIPVTVKWKRKKNNSESKREMSVWKKVGESKTEMRDWQVCMWQRHRCHPALPVPGGRWSRTRTRRRDAPRSAGRSRPRRGRGSHAETPWGSSLQSLRGCLEMLELGLEMDCYDYYYLNEISYVCIQIHHNEVDCNISVSRGYLARWGYLELSVWCGI